MDRDRFVKADLYHLLVVESLLRRDMLELRFLVQRSAALVSVNSRPPRRFKQTNNCAIIIFRLSDEGVREVHFEQVPTG